MAPSVLPMSPKSPESASMREKVQSLRLERGIQKKSQVGLLPWFLSFVLALSTAYFALERTSPSKLAEEGDETSSVSATPSGSSKVNSESASAAPSTGGVASSGGIALEAKGYVIPAHQILVSPKVSGMVLNLYVEEGKRVKKGDILAELESIDYQADVKSQESKLQSAEQKLRELENGFRPEEVEEAKAELAEAEAQLQQYASEFERNQTLRKNKSLSAKEFDQSESIYKSTDRRVARLRAAVALITQGPRVERIEGARADVNQAKADLEKYRWKLSNCTIRAPVSGTILKKNAEEGNIVNPIAFNGSYSLCEMADLSDLEVELTIQERDIAKVFKGQKCTVRAEAFPDRAYVGVVTRLMPIADRAKGAIPVRVKLTVPAVEEGVYLKPEMGAVVTFESAADQRS